MARRFETIEDIAWRGLRLRLWCYACARASELDAAEVLARFAAKGWPLDLASAREHFRCRGCRSSEDVLILPARAAPPLPPAPQPRELTWADQVAAFFHSNRSRRKEKPLPAAYEELLRKLRHKGGRPR